jgi:CRISPR/Cas system CSM-associated protein Csm2 small subunit
MTEIWNPLNLPETELSKNEKLTVLLDFAFNTKNEQIREAFDRLIFLIHFLEPQELSKKIDEVRVLNGYAIERKKRISKKEVYNIIEHTLKTNDNNTLTALENLIELARYRSKLLRWMGQESNYD